MKATIHQVDWEYRSVFRISYQVYTHARTVIELREGDLIGRGEALGVSYHGETIDSLVEQLTRAQHMLRDGITRADLQQLLPPGGARNAIDCALWDLEAKRLGRRAWELAGIAEVRALLTAYTLSLDAPETMARAAAEASAFPLLKLKLSGDGDLERVTRVRAVRPDAQIVVDANQAWSEAQLRDFAPRFAELGVSLIEQPLALGRDEMLSDYSSPVPLCADESCQTSESLAQVKDRYQYVNIKLDKTGGLTEALQLAKHAREAGLKLMVGCMGGSSLSMAPAFVVAQWCDVVDLDGPLLTKADMPEAIQYREGRIFAPAPALWG